MFEAAAAAGLAVAIPILALLLPVSRRQSQPRFEL